MLIVRHAAERGFANHDWLKSYHTFSFANYFDPKHMGFSVLRVINQDWVAPGRGFPSHGHQDMEIISYVLAGGLEHRDSLGNGSVIRAGEVQRMSAGTGIVHSEYNASKTEPVQFLQIWLLPEVKGVKPSYAQKMFDFAARKGFHLVVSPDGAEGSLTIHQAARLFIAHVDEGEAIDFMPIEQCDYYLHLARGQLRLNDLSLQAGDGVKIQQETQLHFTGTAAAEVLLFELPLETII
jgi:redox-sensitive bicupin YhaK (pirin superfamily)